MTESLFARTAARACLPLACATAQAAGGHFEVDDAAMLESGRCQYETWLGRARSASSTTLFHLGPGCRVGPVELGVDIDHLSNATGRGDLAGPRLKWTSGAGTAPLRAGLAWSATFDATHGGRRPLQSLYVPLTWTLNAAFAVNANLGTDRDADGSTTRRLGVSGEWAAREALTVIAERVGSAGAWTSRLGARWALGPSVSLDVSLARRSAERVCIVGLNHDFGR